MFLGILLSLAFFFVVILKLYHAVWSRNSDLPLPPGPKPKFLIGNMLDFPKANSSRVFAEWSNKYNSGLLCASAFGRHIMVINDLKIAEDLLEKRINYNDRPHNHLVQFVEWDSNMALMRYGDQWRQQRKICQQMFHAAAAKEYYDTQRGQVENFLKNVLHQPERVFEHATLLSISSTMLMMYGYAPETGEDQVIQMAEEATRLVTTLFDFGGTIIDVLPFLYYVPAWMPFAEGKRMIERVRKLNVDVKRIPLERVAADVKNGKATSSLLSDFFERKATKGARPGEEEMLSNIAWTVYGAASDTTISATRSFLFLMVTHPEIQRKAQEEIDRVVGNNRLPDFNDRPNLHYIDAIYHEVLRYSPPIPLGIPHGLMEDDVYNGYFLPKGSAIIANIWAMTRDESVYPDSSSFKPERFLDSDGKMKKNSRILAYGFGRRVCAGKYVASNFMWLIMAMFLASFTIKPAIDEMGNEVEVDGTYYELGVISRKRPFKCSITPRSRQLIEESLGSQRH